MLMEIHTIAAETHAVEYLQDNYRDVFAPLKARHEPRTFGLPKSIWWTMFAAYAVFFTAISVATGHNRSALFTIVVSVGYTLMYFGTAAAMNAVGAHARPATVAGDIDTATGRLGYGAAFAQILTVPFVIAFFGCAIAVVSAIVGP